MSDEQNGVWKKLNQLENKLTAISVELKSMPAVMIMMLKDEFPTHEGLENTLTSKRKECEAQFVKKGEFKEYWYKYNKEYRRDNFESGSRIMSVVKWGSWILSPLVTIILALAVWIDKL